MEGEEKIIEEMQAVQYRIHVYLSQKQNLELKLQEIEMAMEELKGSKEGNAYKIVGPIMIKKEKENLIKELENKKNLLELRIKAYEKQIEKLNKRMKELQEKLRGGKGGSKGEGG